MPEKPRPSRGNGYNALIHRKKTRKPEHDPRTGAKSFMNLSHHPIWAPLVRTEEFFRRHRNTLEADWLCALLGDAAKAPDHFWQQLNSTRFWGGAGSLANASLMDNPGVPEHQWAQELRALREDLIAVAEQLQARGPVHPDMQSWLLAFHNWNQSGN